MRHRRNEKRAKGRLLLVEDSERQELLSESLDRAGYKLNIVATAAQLLSSVFALNYDLIIIDPGLPDGDGINAIRTLRAAGVSVPILIITARGNINDRIIGLDSGADDYLIKPFNHGELLARIRALLRRPLSCKPPRYAEARRNSIRGKMRFAVRVDPLNFGSANGGCLLR